MAARACTRARLALLSELSSNASAVRRSSLHATAGSFMSLVEKRAMETRVSARSGCAQPLNQLALTCPVMCSDAGMRDSMASSFSERSS